MDNFDSKMLVLTSAIQIREDLTKIEGSKKKEKNRKTDPSDPGPPARRPNRNRDFFLTSKPPAIDLS